MKIHFSLFRLRVAFSDFHARSRFARSTIPEEKWGITRSLCKFEKSQMQVPLGWPNKSKIYSAA